MSVLPLANLFAMSFYDVTWQAGSAVWRPVGFAHYAALPRDPLFRAGLWSTRPSSRSAPSPGRWCSASFWRCWSAASTRGRVLYRAIFVLPILIPGIVIGAIWKLMLNYDFGLANQVIGLVGLGPHDWLGDPRHGAALRHRRRHLALDAVLLPAVPGRARIPAAGRVRGGQDRRRLGLAGARPRHHADDDADHPGDVRLPPGRSPSRSSTRSIC